MNIRTERVLIKFPSLYWAHPLVNDWFVQKFGSATEPQVGAWPSILAGEPTLISAPTGSGKTLAAFLVCIDGLVRLALDNKLADICTVLYVSPLKALGNDIQKNLELPLKEISALAKKRGLSMQEIRVAVRSGDTQSSERQAMLKKPPHILVTTPESLYILLTAEKSRQLLQPIHTVIIDEIHALADSKRGAHLALSLERLHAITHQAPLRIGLSATQKPLEIVAGFLVGAARKMPAMVNIGHVRQLNLAVEIPSSELGAVASNEMWDEMYDRLAELTKANRSTLIFVNTRRLAERVAHHLAERIGEDKVAAHHGSLSKKLRLAAETKLKNGELTALVATASLELGIDIGSIDLVCQLGSPRGIAMMLQRVGRAGHWHGAISKGRIFATTRDELMECAALVYAILSGDLDKLIMPSEPLDVLAQQIIASCATSDWHENDLFQLMKKAYSYANLSRDTFDAVLSMLSDGIAGSRGRYGVYLLRDRVHGMVRARRGSRLTAITSGGAIPDNGLFLMIAEPNGTVVGTLDEDFAVESNRGDIILLGSTSWQIKRVEASIGRVFVEDAHGAPPSVPFWRGEAPARSNELSLHLSRLRQFISDQLPESASHEGQIEAQPDTIKIITWLKKHCGLDERGALQLVEYILQARKVLGAIPTQDTVIAERFFDEGGGMQLIIHSPFGARINKAWGLALRKRFCRSFNFELQAAATDNGINIALAEQHSFPLADVFQFLHPNTLKEVLEQAVLQSPIFKTRFRFVATRALALVRFRFGKKVPPAIQRMLADDLLAAVFPDAAACQDNLAGRDIVLPPHPLIDETMKEILHDALDIDGFATLIADLTEGKIQYLAVDTPLPSVFSHEILNANPYAFLDDAPLEERRARAVEMRRSLPDSILEEVGKLDPEAIAEVEDEALPDIRDAHELHDLLQTLIALPLDFSLKQYDKQRLAWSGFFSELAADNRATVARYRDKDFYVAAEKAETFAQIYADASYRNQLPQVEKIIPARETAVLELVRGYMLHLGPITASELSGALSLDKNEIDAAFLQLEASGFILRGQFRHTKGELEWCERRLLARIHKLTVARLRKEIEPVTAAQFVNWLLTWQHLAPGTQLHGEQGLLQIIKQLQGFEIPANAWESQILAKRMKHYDPEMLDHLCLSGTLGWGRLSLSAPTKKRIMPSSVAPMTFFVREEADWMRKSPAAEDLPLLGLSNTALAIYDYLKQHGASFFADMVRGLNKLKSEVELGLWELVAAGLITADGFDNLRALIDPKRRLLKRGRRRSIVPRLSSGRWSILHTDTIDPTQHIEASCWMLLNRYGVVFRDLLTREKNIPKWRELLIILRRLEDRGEIRGGRFVSGFLGEQFALPHVVPSLRASKKQLLRENKVTVAAVDPLNLIGIILPGAKSSAFSGNEAVLSFDKCVEQRGSLDGSF